MAGVLAQPWREHYALEDNLNFIPTNHQHHAAHSFPRLQGIQHSLLSDKDTCIHLHTCLLKNKSKRHCPSCSSWVTEWVGVLIWCCNYVLRSFKKKTGPWEIGPDAVQAGGPELWSPGKNGMQWCVPVILELGRQRQAYGPVGSSRSKISRLSERICL